jgi:hypothetical protein
MLPDKGTQSVQAALPHPLIKEASNPEGAMVTQ